ncbi:MAG: CHAD domain-containing protein [Anaerolineae bacterium]|nr:CHAD domain-containing protein [Anaerolineae bacterium]
MEIEAKFSVLSEETLATLRSLVHLGEYDLTPGEAIHLYDTYLDTPDRSIYGSGHAFRRRLQDGYPLLSLKSLGFVSGGVHHREELEVEEPEALSGLVPCEWPEGPVRDEICTLTNDEPLELLFTVEQQRLLRHVVDASGARVAYMALDTGVVTLPNGRTQQTFTELEIELGPGRTEKDLDCMLAELAGMPGLIPQPTSKFERGLAFASRGGADKPKSHKVRTNDTFGRAMSKILMPLFLRMQDHEQGSYDGTDPEELHDMRVATRRMRTAFWIAEPYLDNDVLKRVRKGLSQTATVLGAVRDMDVFRDYTMAYLAEAQLSASDFALLFHVWDVEYIGRRNDMLAHLSSKAYAKFKKAFWDQLRAGMPEKARARRASDLVPVIVQERLTTVLNHGALVATEGLPLATYHALRIDVKRLRYTLEFFRDILGPTAREAITAMEALQDFLGDLQDARVAAEHLRAVTGFGTWEAPQQAHTLWSPGMPVTATDRPAVNGALAAYLTAQESRIEALLTRAPTVWRSFLEARFPQLVEEAISAIERPETDGAP